MAERKRPTPKPSISSLADEGYALTRTIKKLNNRLNEIKALVKAHAEKTKTVDFEGKEGKIKVGKTTSTNIDPYPVYEAIGIEDFLKTVSVGVTALKATIGDTKASEFISKVSNPYGSVKFSIKDKD